MTTWVDHLGELAIRAPAGLRRRARFARAAVLAAVRAPRAATRREVARAGLRQLPLTGLVGLALGVLVVGQAVALLRQVSAHQYIGTVMVTVVLRELGPLLVAFLVAARSGPALVVELGTHETQEHWLRELVGPRVRALAVTVPCLTIYLIAIALGSGYLVAFLQGVPLRWQVYTGQLANAVHWLDFGLIGLKAILFGVVIGVVSCYHGWVQTLRIEELPGATTRAVVESMALCVLLDVVFLVGYFGR
ncbi:MAG: putative phospholipid ABC transporter permease protein MlaE [Verrucomicrobiae bacterium]|nr:putative phospholipid ABC transporter permease protein MlaE [Verrucomicrobiae bacterium]